MVIQRIQTLFLLLAVMSLTVFGFIPQTMSVVYVAILTLLAALIALIDIFCFKNFKMQFLLCNISMILAAAAVITGILTLPENPQYGWFALPIFGMFMLIMAKNRIKADKKMLESIDRLR